MFSECPTPRESRAEEGDQGWCQQRGSTGAAGAWAPVGQGALSPWLALHPGTCPQSLVAHEDTSLAPRLGQRGFISIKNGNQMPGLWGVHGGGDSCSGGWHCHQRDRTAVGVCGGMALLGRQVWSLCREQICGTEESGPSCWLGNVPWQEVMVPVLPFQLGDH